MTRQRHGLEAASFTGAMWALAGLGVLLLILPTLVVVVVSFTSGFSLRFPPQGYSLRWYYALLDAWQLHFAAATRFEVACWTTALAAQRVSGAPAHSCRASHDAQEYIFEIRLLQR